MQKKQKAHHHRSQFLSIKRTKASFYYIILLFVLIYLFWQKTIFSSLNISCILFSLCVHTLSTKALQNEILKINLISLKNIIHLIETLDSIEEAKIKSTIQTSYISNQSSIFKINQIMPLWEFFGVFLPIILSILGPVLSYIQYI